MIEVAPAQLEPHVDVTRYEVSILPLGHRERSSWTLTVEYRGPDSWAVLWGGMALSSNDGFDYEPSSSNRDDDYKATHRFPLAQAILRAKRVAPKLTVNGWTAREVLAGRRDTPSARQAPEAP